MDISTIIIIVILIIFIIVGIYFYQEISEKIDILTDENIKSKEDKTTLMDEQSELKKTVRRVANDINERLTRTENKLEDEAFTLSANNKHSNPVGSYNKYTLPHREQPQQPQQPQGTGFLHSRIIGMPAEMQDKFLQGQSEGRKQNNYAVNEEMSDPSNKISQKNIEQDRMDPGVVAMERRGEGFVDNTWKTVNPSIVQTIQNSQPQPQSQNQNFTPDNEEFQLVDEFISGNFDLDNEHSMIEEFIN